MYSKIHGSLIDLAMICVALPPHHQFHVEKSKEGEMRIAYRNYTCRSRLLRRRAYQRKGKKRAAEREEMKLTRTVSKQTRKKMKWDSFIQDEAEEEGVWTNSALDHWYIWICTCAGKGEYNTDTDDEDDYDLNTADKELQDFICRDEFLQHDDIIDHMRLFREKIAKDEGSIWKTSSVSICAPPC